MPAKPQRAPSRKPQGALPRAGLKAPRSGASCGPAPYCMPRNEAHCGFITTNFTHTVSGRNPAARTTQHTSPASPRKHSHSVTVPIPALSPQPPNRAPEPRTRWRILGGTASPFSSAEAGRGEEAIGGSQWGGRSSGPHTLLFRIPAHE